MNSPQLFQEMLKTRIAPALRELGMRGSGQNYRLPSQNGDHALLGFQKDSWDGTTRFTANVAFYSGPAWQEARARHGWLPAEPTASSTYAVADLQEWSERVGFLMDPPHDHWWIIQNADEVPSVADHVVAVVREAVLPQLQARLAGREPPPVPGREAGPVANCPAPTCAHPPVPWAAEGSLVSIDGLVSACDDGAAGLNTGEREVLVRARTATVPRSRAWKVLHISRSRLDTYADRIGADDALTFVQLLAVDLLGTDDLLTPVRWPEAVEVVAAWAAQLPNSDPDATLVVGEDAVAVMPLAAALTRNGPSFGNGVVQPLMTATQYLLGELNRAGAV